MTVTMQVTLRVSPAVVSGDVITVTFGGGSAGGIEGGKLVLCLIHSHADKDCSKHFGSGTAILCSDNYRTHTLLHLHSV